MLGALLIKRATSNEIALSNRQFPTRGASQAGACLVPVNMPPALADRGSPWYGNQVLPGDMPLARTTAEKVGYTVLLFQENMPPAYSPQSVLLLAGDGQ